jgi:TetR/AcrR family transcriptional regulator, transcriptional repressor for nem operon
MILLYQLVGTLLDMKGTKDMKERFIDAAMELISARSYTAVGVQELCDHVGVTKGSFYHYFRSKRDLTLATIDKIWTLYQRNFLEPLFDSDVPILERFHRLLNSVCDYYDTQKEATGNMAGCKLGNLSLELSTQDEAIRQKLELVFKKWIMYLKSVLDEAVVSGELPDNTDTRASAQSILAYLEGLALLGKTFNDPGFMRQLNWGIPKLILHKNEQADVVS